MDESTLDSCLELVADPQRRAIVRRLRDDGDGETTVTALLDRLYLESEPEDAPPPDREQFAVQLHHVHLPELAAHGIVDYDPEDGTVRYYPDNPAEAVLASLPDELESAAPESVDTR